MSEDNFNSAEYIKNIKEIIVSHLESYLNIRYPNILWEAMRYTSISDGKMIRPLLVVESAKACGGSIDNVIPVACALEMVHSYSLIHDDLPCMDNDDFRRGKPTNHKVYGEAIAVLAGDALLSYAPQIIIQRTPQSVSRESLLNVLEEFFVAIGPLGLVGGQVADINYENKEIDFAALNYIHTKKTGELFKFAARAGALISETSSEKLEAMTKYGEYIGYAFQVADDILDVIGTKEVLGKTPGKDKSFKKVTHVDLYGINESIKEVERLCELALAILASNHLDTPLLVEIAGNVAKKIRQ